MKLKRLPTLIFIAMLLGVLAGTAAHHLAPDADTAKSIADHLSILTDVFLRMIKMIIGPLVFATLVSGIASMGDGRAVGRIGLKAMLWFVGASITSLLLGLIMANVLTPGLGMNLPLPPADAVSSVKTASLNLRDFIAHMFPKSFVEAMATNEILQIVVFSLFFGFALGTVKDGVGKPVLAGIEGLAQVMLKVTNYVMAFAPIGVFGAISAVITAQGLGVLAVYAKLLGSFYLGLALLWAALLAGGAVFLGRDVFTLVRTLRAPLMIGFATASSESAYPKVIEQLTRFGVKPRITNFVLPLGYSFNLDGSIMYTSFAALFVAQVYGIHLSLTQQITMLLVLLVTSKGIAGVPRASLVVVAAVLPMFGLPEAGILLVLGIDHVLDMGRTVTNVLGNAIATTVVARSENAIGAPDFSEDEADDNAVSPQGAGLGTSRVLAGK
ncbi:dicarboxylate/amino acid:cation symporter [Cupriavidus plantarum]|uniref:dicarboxylate/amino acid:cation symporter n=1 Tax=Cupriavidus plantarum TaxID=942865 RepID=UPI000E227752|nr:dicarboxylate/amino acid:cation symporter [Cupriavidus plantarum]REE91987.1 Na+/H+-dicarboxylate symporter [Cupriavidus plantarum]